MFQGGAVSKWSQTLLRMCDVFFLLLSSGLPINISFKGEQAGPHQNSKQVPIIWKMLQIILCGYKNTDAVNIVFSCFFFKSLYTCSAHFFLIGSLKFPLKRQRHRYNSKEFGRCWVFQTSSNPKNEFPMIRESLWHTVKEKYSFTYFNFIVYVNCEAQWEPQPTHKPTDKAGEAMANLKLTYLLVWLYL